MTVRASHASLSHEAGHIGRIDARCASIYARGMARRTTLNVSLTPELSQFIERRLRSGKYTTASEVVRAALRLLEERERVPVQGIAELKAEIEHGLEQLRRGESVDGDTFFTELRAGRN